MDSNGKKKGRRKKNSKMPTATCQTSAAVFHLFMFINVFILVYNAKTFQQRLNTSSWKTEY